MRSDLAVLGFFQTVPWIFVAFCATAPFAYLPAAADDGSIRADTRINLSGTVTGPDGLPVMALSSRFDGRGSYPSPSSSNQYDTDAKGRYSIRTLRLGRFLCLDVYHGSLVAEPIIGFEIQAEPAELVINRRLAPGKKITGKITWGPDKLPVADHEIELTRDESLPGEEASARFGQDLFHYRWVHTKSDGVFEMHVPPGKYRFQTPSDPFGRHPYQQTIEVTADSADTVVNVNLRYQPNRKLRCRVVDSAGQPVKGISVVADQYTRSRTNEHGVADFDRLPCKAHTFMICEWEDGREDGNDGVVQSYPMQNNGNRGNPAKRTISRGIVRPLGPGAKDVTLTLLKPVGVKGRVLDSDLRQPLEGVNVHLCRGDWREEEGGRFRVYNQDAWSPVRPDAEGRFAFENLLPGGSYRLHLSRSVKSPENERETTLYGCLGYFTVPLPDGDTDGGSENGSENEKSFTELELPDFYAQQPTEWSPDPGNERMLESPSPDIFIENLASALDAAARKQKQVLLLFSDFETKGFEPQDQRSISDSYTYELTPYVDDALFKEVLREYVVLAYEVENFLEPPGEIAFITKQLGFSLEKERGCVLCILDDTGVCVAKRSLADLGRPDDPGWIDPGKLRKFLEATP